MEDLTIGVLALLEDSHSVYDARIAKLESDVDEIATFLDSSQSSPSPTPGTNNYDHDYMRISDQLLKVTQELRQFSNHSHADGKVVIPFESVLDET